MKNDYPKKGNKACLFKRSLAFILSCAIAAPLLVPENTQKRVEKTVHAATENVTYGDVNSDGKISILDMIALKSYITENNTRGFSVKAADLDGDGTVSAKDAVELSMFLLNQTGIFSYEMNIDTDGDGLCDYVEKEILKTDYLKKDTDGDGLDDYSEVYLCDTDPLNTDTGKTGVKDSAKDADGDKLTNAEEITLGTSPVLTDTDEDGLSDYDEVKKYKTNPLKEDTDGDGISDNGEIKLGLDPLKVKSDGKTSDVERTFEQKISSENDMLKIVNNEDSPYQLSISAKSAGYINEAVSIDISAYSNYLQNDAVAGDIIDIDYADDFKIESMKIIFSVSENAANYFIFRYSEDVNMLLPVETLYDGNEIYTECSEDGTYCIVDMDMWISNSASPEEIKSANVLYNAAYASSKYETKTSDDDIEVYFLVYSKGTLYTSTIDSITKASRLLIDYCNSTGKNIKIYYAGYLGRLTTLPEVQTQFVSNSSTDEDIVSMVSQIKNATQYYDTSNYTCSLSIALQMGIYEAASGDEKRDKYCFVVDIGFQPACDDALSVIKSFENLEVDFSFISADTNNNVKLYDAFSSDGAHIKWTPDFSENIISKVIGNVVTYNLNTGFCNRIPYDDSLITSEWKEIYEKFYSGKLSAEEIKKLGLPDTDGDGTPDCLEIFMKYIKFDSNGNIILPTYDELARDAMKNSILGLKGLDELADIMKKKGIDISNLRILPLISNPTAEDSDFDGIPDIIDKNPTSEDIISIDDTIINDNKVFNTDYKTISNKFVDGNGLAFSHSGNLKNNAIEYTRVIRGDGNAVTKFYVEPKDNSDYLITVDIADNSDCKIKVTYVTGMFKKEHVVTADNCETKGKNKACYSLNKGIKYKITITVKSKPLSSNTYKVSVEQNNWVYAPNGGIQTVIPYNFYFPLEKVFISTDTLKNALKIKYKFLLDKNGSVEAQTHTIMKQLGLDNGGKVLFDSLLTFVGTFISGSATVAALTDPEPGSKILIACLADGINTYFVASSIQSTFGYFESKEFEKACNEGNLNIIFTKGGQITFSQDVWETWNTAPYIKKYDNDSMNGVVKRNIDVTLTPETVIDYCGFN